MNSYWCWKEESKFIQCISVNDSKSAFYATDKITKTLVRKARNSLYEKGIVLVNIYNGLENKKISTRKIPLNAPFVEKNKTLFVQCYTAFSRPFEALQVDIACCCYLA